MTHHRAGPRSGSSKPLSAEEQSRQHGIDAVAKGLGPEHSKIVAAMRVHPRMTAADLAKAVVLEVCQSRAMASDPHGTEVIVAACAEWDASAELRAGFDGDKRAFLTYRTAAGGGIRG